MELLAELEFSILYWFQGLHNPFLDQLMPAVSFLGNSGWAFIVLGVVLFSMKKTRRVGLAILLSLAAGFLIGNVLIKNLVMRSRPCWIDQAVPLLIPSPHDFSFPSGHTLASFETAFSVFLYSRRRGIPMLILAALIALSRLYLFVHFPTDVLSGMALGIFIGWYVHRTIENRKNRAILRA